MNQSLPVLLAGGVRAANRADGTAGGARAHTGTRGKRVLRLVCPAVRCPLLDIDWLH